MRKQTNVTGLLAMFLVSAYYVYRNRERIQRFLDSNDIHLPKNTEQLKDTLRSGITRIRGNREHPYREAG